MSGEFEEVFQKMADRVMLTSKPREPLRDPTLIVRLEFLEEWRTTKECKAEFGVSRQRAFAYLRLKQKQGFVVSRVKRTEHLALQWRRK